MNEDMKKAAMVIIGHIVEDAAGKCTGAELKQIAEDAAAALVAAADKLSAAN